MGGGGWGAHGRIPLVGCEVDWWRGHGALPGLVRGGGVVVGFVARHARYELTEGGERER